MANRLIHEASPYLLQHAHNPVDWYPWGEEAFERARKEDKPVFLSVGYSACHWCHVMERESFDNEEIARVLNEHFVSIKVDREERPDVDEVYQTVCQLATRQGGWPLSVFLTPDARPFFAGTYFPPDDRYGRPGFARLLLALVDAYKNRRDEVDRVGGRFIEALGQLDATPAPAADPLNYALVREGCQDLAKNFDWQSGGFGQAPKFPNPTNLDLFLRHYHQEGEQEYLDMAVLALKGMLYGGIYDHLGGGFHRYSVDAHWLVPHFEKMLYDNALLPPLYLAAYQLTGDSEFARAVRETLAYVEREMTHPEGGFYSTQDADSEGEEGKFFVWTPDEVIAVLGPEEGKTFCQAYGVTEKGKFEHGTTVLHLEGPAPHLEAARHKLFAVREQRVKPFRDEKVLTGWNGLMISAFARAARGLNHPPYAEAARRAARFILEKLRAPDGGLLRRYKDGEAGIAGFLDDYAYFAQGLIDLYEATFERRWLDEAVRLTRLTLERFWDGEAAGFFLTQAGGEALIHRPKDHTDSAVPAGNSIAVLNLLRLHPFTGDAALQDAAERTLKAYRSHMDAHPFGMASLLSALAFYLSGALEVVIVAPENDTRANEWAARVGEMFQPARLLTRITPAEAGAADAPPIWAGKPAVKGQATLYVCRNFSCSPPATTWAEALKHLA